MKFLRILVLILCVSLISANAISQTKSGTLVCLSGTVTLAKQKVVMKDFKLKKVDPVQQNVDDENSVSSQNKQESIQAQKFFDIKTEFETIEGAVVRFTNEKGDVFSATTDKNGKYRISLPLGKYTIYSTASEGCWMCAEYYSKDLLIVKKRKIILDITLRFFGEG